MARALVRGVLEIGGGAWAVTLLALALGCAGPAGRDTEGSGGGSADRGRQAIERFGCGACHTIPGIPGAQASVGPSLQGIGRRARLAGDLPNTPDNMVRWIRTPQDVVADTMMPNLGIGDLDARDIAAYLRTLR